MSWCELNPWFKKKKKEDWVASADNDSLALKRFAGFRHLAKSSSAFIEMALFLHHLVLLISVTVWLLNIPTWLQENNKHFHSAAISFSNMLWSSLCPLFAVHMHASGCCWIQSWYIAWFDFWSALTDNYSALWDWVLNCFEEALWLVNESERESFLISFPVLN